MNGALREFLKDAEQLGFMFAGYNGKNHVQLQHINGYRYAAPLTPSDWRSRRNTIADLQRISGRKLPRQNAGKHRHRRQAQLNTTLSPAERQASDLIAELVDEADTIAQRIDQLRAEPPTTRSAAEMRRHLTRHRSLRSQLRQMHRIVPPIDGTE